MNDSRALLRVLPPLRALCTALKAGDEVELRLVRAQGGLAREEFALLLDFFRAKQCWAAQPVMQSTIDVTYDKGVRSTSVENGGAGGVSYMKKRRLGSAALAHASGLRLVLTRKSEEPLRAPHLSAPRWTRIKKRVSFEYKEVRYDFTVVWAAATAEEAKRLPPTYEVEVELLPAKLQGDAGLDLFIAASLVEKGLEMVRLLRPESPFYAVAPADPDP